MGETDVALSDLLAGASDATLIELVGRAGLVARLADTVAARRRRDREALGAGGDRPLAKRMGERTAGALVARSADAR